MSEHASLFSQVALSLWSAVRRSEDKKKLYNELLSAVGKRPQMRNIADFVDLQAHGEIITIEVQFVPPS